MIALFCVNIDGFIILYTHSSGIEMCITICKDVGMSANLRTSGANSVVKTHSFLWKLALAMSRSRTVLE